MRIIETVDVKECFRTICKLTFWITILLTFWIFLRSKVMVFGDERYFFNRKIGMKNIEILRSVWLIWKFRMNSHKFTIFPFFKCRINIFRFPLRPYTFDYFFSKDLNEEFMLFSYLLYYDDLNVSLFVLIWSDIILYFMYIYATKNTEQRIIKREEWPTILI